MTQSSELLEIAQNGVAQIVEHHDQGEIRARRHVWQATVYFFIGFAALVAINIWMQRQTVESLGKPQPAAVLLHVEKPASVPILCPGDVLQYKLTLEIDEPNTGDVVVNVRNIATHRTEIATRQPRIDDQVGIVEVATNWTIPRQLEPIGTRPARPWTAGLHKRIISITSDVGNKEAAQAVIWFIISSTCANVRL